MVPSRGRTEDEIFRVLGANVGDRDKAFLRKSAELNSLIGVLMGVQRAHNIPGEHMDLMIEGFIALIDRVTRDRVDVVTEPEPEEEP